MKYSIIIIFLFKLTELVSQTMIQTNEIGINLVSFEKTTYGNPYNSPELFSGITYIRHAEKLNYRSGIEYFDYHYASPTTSGDFFTEETKKSFNVFVGAQKQLLKNKFRINFSLDLLYYYQKYIFSEAGGIYSYSHSGDHIYNKFILSPAAGFQFYINKHLSLTTESALEYGLYFKDDNMNYDSGYMWMDKPEFYLIDRIKLNIHF